MGLFQKIDLHIHSRVSDGTDYPSELIGRAVETGLDLFALTDHDAAKGCLEVRELLGKDDPAFISGAEFSCRDEEGKYHILGYGFYPDSEPVKELVSFCHGIRIKKVLARLDFLRTEFGFAFPEQEIAHLLENDNPGKPHIGNLMVKYGYAESKEQAIHEFINKKRFRTDYVRPEKAIEAIVRGGGIPVLAHPSYGDGDSLILGDEMDVRLKHLMELGIRGVEAFYSGFTPKLIKEMNGFAARYDLYVTAGSDYHGTNKINPLGDTGLISVDDAPAGLIRFLNDVRMENR